LILLFLSSVYLRKLKTRNKQIGSPSFLGGLGNQFVGILKSVIELKDINTSNRLDKNCVKRREGVACDRLDFYYMTDIKPCIQPDTANIATTAKGNFIIKYYNEQVYMIKDTGMTYGDNMKGKDYNNRCFNLYVNSGKLTVTTHRVCSLKYENPKIVPGGDQFQMGKVEIGFFDSWHGTEVLKIDFDGSKLKMEVNRPDGGWSWRPLGDANSNAQHGFELCVAKRDNSFKGDELLKKNNCCDDKDHPQICLPKIGGGLICRPNEGKIQTVVTLYSFDK